MKVTLVLCVLAMAMALVLGSDGHDAGHGDAGHGHDDGGHGGGAHDAGHGGDHGGHADGGHGDGGHGNSATSLQLCSTLLSFVVLAALNKLR